MSRKLVIGGLAVAILGSGSVAVLSRLTGGTPSIIARDAPAASGSEAAPAVSAPPFVATPSAGAPSSGSPVVSVVAAPVPADPRLGPSPDGSKRSNAPRPLNRAERKLLRSQVMTGLDDLRPYFERCPRKSAQPRPDAGVAEAQDHGEEEALLQAMARVNEVQGGDSGQGGLTHDQEVLLREIGTLADKVQAGSVARSPEPRMQAVLVLEIETLDGKVQIVDAPLQAKGSASDAFATCVQDALVGRVIPVRAAKVGRHMRMAFPLGSSEVDPGAQSGSERNPPPD